MKSDYKVEVNFAALGTKLARALDPVIERTAFGLCTAESGATQVRLPGFFRVDLPESRKRDVTLIREDFRTWILTAGFRDAIECMHTFLDEARMVCAVVELGAHSAVFTVADWNRCVVGRSKCFHKMGLPDKLTYLKEKHQVGVCPELEENILSLNRARNCLVHRVGVVSAQYDTNDSGQLQVSWRRRHLLARGPEGERELAESEAIVQAGESILLRSCAAKRAFEVGAKVLFNAREFSELCMTLFAFEQELATAIEGRAKNLAFNGASAS
jgi:hypothetical protein